MAGARETNGAKTRVDILRSPLGRARGLGSARAGMVTWWAERVTSMALVPLTLWFVLSVFRLQGASRQEVEAWASHTLTATLLLALVLVTFRHMQLGLQAVIEDYIHTERQRLAALLALKGAVGLLGLIAVVSALKLALAF
jgi:succinate dehydrogenase / fumarate reductase membrane anchor subunit